MHTQGDPIFLFLAGKVQKQFGVGDVVGCIYFLGGFNIHKALQGIPLAPWPEDVALCAGQIQPAKLLRGWDGGKLHEPCRRVVLEKGAYLIMFPELFIEAQSGKVVFS